MFARCASFLCCHVSDVQPNTNNLPTLNLHGPLTMEEQGEKTKLDTEGLTAARSTRGTAQALPPWLLNLVTQRVSSHGDGLGTRARLCSSFKLCHCLSACQRGLVSRQGEASVRAQACAPQCVPTPRVPALPPDPLGSPCLSVTIYGCP